MPGSGGVQLDAQLGEFGGLALVGGVGSLGAGFGPIGAALLGVALTGEVVAFAGEFGQSVNTAAP